MKTRIRRSMPCPLFAVVSHWQRLSFGRKDEFAHFSLTLAQLVYSGFVARVVVIPLAQSVRKPWVDRRLVS
jgi:hypothetical protein